MCQDTIKHLKETLIAILIQETKSAEYLNFLTSIRMTDHAGDLLYKILGKQYGGWVRVNFTFRLNECKCITRQVNNYRYFYPCPLHALEIYDLLVLKQTKIPIPRPVLYYVLKDNKPKKKKYYTLKPYKPRMPKHFWPHRSLVVSGGLCS
jgi:hypothetical protein